MFSLAVGILFFWLVTYILIAVVVMAVGSFGDDPPGSVYGIMILSAAAGPIAWVIARHYYLRHRLMRPTRPRTERLSRVVRHPSSFARLPHRHVEWLLRHRPTSLRRIRALIRECAAGQVFVIIDPRERTFPLPQPTALHFEPIALHSDIDEAVRLCHASFDGAEQPPDVESEAPAKFTWRDLKAAAGALLPLACLAGAVGWALWLAIARHQFSWMLIVLGPVVAVFLLKLLAERQWWIVPGGLAFREDYIWRRTLNIQLLTAPQSTICIDLCNDRILVAHGVRTLSIRSADLMCHAVLAGWISQARTPTEAEIRSLLSGE